MADIGDPRSWYPVALSRELCAKPIPLRVFGGDFVLFRSEFGAVSALGRYCLHMGADLARGRIAGDSLRCRLHGWVYGGDGVCRHVEGEEAKTRARLRKLAVHEAGGIVFVWPGPEPEWPFPELRGIRNPRAARPCVEEFDCPMQAVGLNGFDIWHYGTVHYRCVRSPPDICSIAQAQIELSFAAAVQSGRLYDDLLIALGYGTLRVKLDYWGGNLAYVYNASGGYVALIAMIPAGQDHCRVYLTVFTEARTSWVSLLVQGVLLEVFRAVAWRFLKSDVPFVSGMRPTEGLLVTGRDDAAHAFWRWWRALPRIESVPA